MNEMQEEKLVHALSLGLKQDWSLSTKIRYSHLLTIGVEMELIEETADMVLELLEMLAEEGEEKTFRYIREEFLRKAKTGTKF